MTHRLLAAALLGVVTTTSLAMATPPREIDTENRFQYTILSQDLRETLTQFGANIGISMTIDDAVKGKVSNFQGLMSAHDFLEQLTRRYGLEWYYDGVSIHVTPASKNRSVVVDFEKVPPKLLTETLDTLGVADPRFEVRTAGDSGIGVLSGPPRYIQLVENAFTLLEQRQAVPETAEGPAVTAPRRSNILIIRGDSAQLWRGKNAVGDEQQQQDGGQAPTNPEPIEDVRGSEGETPAEQ